MRHSVLLISALFLVAVGCGSKEAASSDTSAQATPSASPAAGTAQTAPPAADSGDMKSKVVGDWTMKNTQGNTNVEGNIAIHDDGTFTNAGTVSGETPGEDGTVSITLSYSIAGKWTLEGDMISTTPDEIKTHVEDIQIKTKDPAKQAAADAKKEDLAKQAEDQTKASLNKPSKTKVESATADELHLAQANGVKIVYTRKKEGG